jgi:pyruvate dehydrogenase E1 component beta subunit
MTELTFVEAVNFALKQEMRRDKSIVILGEDVGRDGGVFRATDGIQRLYGESRVIDTPLSELGIVGASLGLALGGMKPVAEIQFDGFVYGAFDQVISHISRMRNRSRGRYSCPLVIRIPYGGGIKAIEHHSETPETYFSHVPGIKVVMPSGPYDAKGLLLSAMRDPDPVIFFEPKKIYRSFREDVPDGDYTVPIGQAAVKKEGTDVTLISWGSSVRTCLEAANSSDKSVEVVDLRTISPMDTDTILNSVQKTGRVLIVHEAPRSFGAGAEVSARIAERSILNLKAPIMRVTGYDVTTPYPKLEDYNLPDAYRISRAISKIMEF